MRRRAALLLIGLAGTTVLAGVVAAPYVIAERGWAALQARVDEAMGARIAVDGPIQGRLWPKPRLILAGLEATAPGDPDGPPLVYADHAKIEIGWQALITGRLDSGRIQLRSVRVLALPFHPPADVDGSFSPSQTTIQATFEGGSLRAMLRPDSGDIRLEGIAVRAGSLATNGAGRLNLRGGTRLVLNLDRLRWGDAELGPADIAATTERDGILIERAALRPTDGSEAAIFGLVTAGGGELRFAGGFDGRTTIEAARLQASARLSGRLGRDSQGFEADEIDIRVGPSHLTGRLRFDTAAAPQLAAELRADHLDVDMLGDAALGALAPLALFPSGDLRLRANTLAWASGAAHGVVLDVARRDYQFELRELAARDLGGVPLHVAGRFVSTIDGRFAFNSMEFRYGKVTGRGRIAVDPGASPLRIQADLQTGPLALDAIIPTSPPLPAEPLTRRALAAAARKAQTARREWSSEPLPWPVLPPIEADLHLIAPMISWRDLRLDVAALDARLSAGVMAIENLSGLVFGGRIELSGRIAGSTEHPEIEGTLRLSDLDLKEVLQTYAGIGEISGRLDGAADLAAAGRSPAELIASLDGKVTVEGRDGVMTGYDLPRMSARLHDIRRPTDLFEVVRTGLGTGRTPFRGLAGIFRVERGVAHTQDLRLTAVAGEARTTGTVDLAAWRVDLASEFRLTEHPGLPPIGLNVSGPIESPRRVFDIQQLQSSLIRRGRPAVR